jgi:lysophospholipase
MELVAADANPIPSGAVVAAVATEDGVTLRAARWPPLERQRRGTVVLVQGRNECIEKYFETVADLRGRGFAVATFDWRGQGGSERVLRSGRCHIESYRDYDRDLRAVMRHVVLPDCPPPHFALAHSMGALACLRAARDGSVRFERMVLLSPMLGFSRAVSPPLAVIRLATGIRLFFGEDEQPISRRPWERWRALEPEMSPRQARFREVLNVAPELATGLPTVRWVYSALLAIREVLSEEFTRSVKIPTLLVIAGRDVVVANDAIEAFSRRLKAAGHIVIPGAQHEILMEPDVLRDMFWAAFDAFVPGTPPEPLPQVPSQDAENTVV